MILRMLKTNQKLETMKVCPTCQKRIDSGASTCPGCGKRFTSWQGIVLAILIGLVVGGVFFARSCAESAAASEKMDRILQRAR
jgi:uncharacterized protein (UPF0212 family)